MLQFPGILITLSCQMAEPDRLPTVALMMVGHGLALSPKPQHLQSQLWEGGWGEDS